MGIAMGECMDGLSGREALGVITNTVASLVSDVGCDIPLKKLGIAENEIDFLVNEASKQTRVMGHATYKMNHDEIRQVFVNAL